MGKGLICGGLARVFGYGNIVPLAVGLGLFQVGEFAFVLARVGLRTGAISADLYAYVLSTAVVTMVLTPVAARLTGPLYVLRTRWGTRPPVQTISLPSEGLREHVVIAGGGRVGQYIAHVLQRMELPYVVIELNHRRVEQCQAAGMPVLYGDASHPVVLEAAAVAHARLLMLTVPPITVAQAIVAEVRRLAPALRIVARAEGIEQMQRLHALGVAEVVQPECEAGLEMVRQALVPLDIPAEEIVRYTDTVREELYAPLYQTNADYQTLTHLRQALHVLGFTWIPVADDSPLAGQTLQDLRLRSATGTTVVAILRNGVVVPNPDGTQRLSAGDVVGVLGNTEQRQAVQALGQPAVPRALSAPGDD
jgi:CPA2 family monovalent cation:H+ antiporter-2